MEIRAKVGFVNASRTSSGWLSKLRSLPLEVGTKVSGDIESEACCCFGRTVFDRLKITLFAWGPTKTRTAFKNQQRTR
jgi:hypothetical protein